MPQQLKKRVKTKQKDKQEAITKLGELSDIAVSKDDDFTIDLDIDASRFHGKAGQCGKVGDRKR